ncbi:hypothetical protein VTO42DRAFT_4884 [Malbranchea cinnamomea]
MSLTLKLSSLVIRTLSKPIANQIKAQAREHERFRRLCVSFAQSLHRVDMRLRLGLLQSSAQIEKQMARDAAEAAAKKQKAQIPTVKTEAQMKADLAAEAKLEKAAHEAAKPLPMPRIRPLSEAKAIDMGANFISEAFLFLVAAGVIVFESLRARRKETSRREDVADRLAELEESEKAARRALVALEHEILRLRAQLEKRPVKESRRILSKEIWEEEEEVEEVEPPSLLTRVINFFSWKSSEEPGAGGASGNKQSTEQPKEVAARPQNGATASAPSTKENTSTSSSQK